MSPNVTDLSPEQHQAIDLYVSGKTTGDIAEELGVHRRTLWRWRQLPAFQQLQRELAERRRAEMQENMAEILRLSLVALKRELTDAENPKRYNPINTAFKALNLFQPNGLLADQPPTTTNTIEIV